MNKNLLNGIRAITALGLFTSCLLVWAQSTQNSSRSPALQGDSVRDLERQVVMAVNEQRAKRGLPPLKQNPVLAHEAKIHSLDMQAKRIPFGHQYFSTRIKHIYRQVKNCNGGSENVAWFPPSKSPRDVVNLWLTSSGHRRNILGHYNLTGVGIARDKRGWVYYTQVFIRTNKT